MESVLGVRGISSGVIKFYINLYKHCEISFTLTLALIFLALIFFVCFLFVSFLDSPDFYHKNNKKEI